MTRRDSPSLVSSRALTEAWSLTSSVLATVSSDLSSVLSSPSVFVSSLASSVLASGLAGADFWNRDVRFFRDQFFSVPVFETSWRGTTGGGRRGRELKSKQRKWWETNNTWQTKKGKFKTQRKLIGIFWKTWKNNQYVRKEIISKKKKTIRIKK